MSFQQWLIGEMGARGWTQSELSRRAKITRGAISNVIKNQRDPGPEMCKALAMAFHLPVEDVFRRAGLLPASVKENQRIRELGELAQRMDDRNIDELLEIARLKLHIQEGRGKYDVPTKKQ